MAEEAREDDRDPEHGQGVLEDAPLGRADVLDDAGCSNDRDVHRCPVPVTGRCPGPQEVPSAGAGSVNWSNSMTATLVTRDQFSSPCGSARSP